MSRGNNIFELDEDDVPEYARIYGGGGSELVSVFPDPDPEPDDTPGEVQPSDASQSWTDDGSDTAATELFSAPSARPSSRSDDQGHDLAPPQSTKERVISPPEPDDDHGAVLREEPNARKKRASLPEQPDHDEAHPIGAPQPASGPQSHLIDTIGSGTSSLTPSPSDDEDQEPESAQPKAQSPKLQNSDDDDDTLRSSRPSRADSGSAPTSLAASKKVPKEKIKQNKSRKPVFSAEEKRRRASERKRRRRAEIRADPKLHESKKALARKRYHAKMLDPDRVESEKERRIQWYRKKKSAAGKENTVDKRGDTQGSEQENVGSECWEDDDGSEDGEDTSGENEDGSEKDEDGTKGGDNRSKEDEDGSVDDEDRSQEIEDKRPN